MKALQDRLDKRRSREIQKLSSLLQISQAVAGTLDLRTAFQDVFETLSRHHDAVRSALILVNKDTREAAVEAVAGPGRPPQPAALNGGSVIGRVIESGKLVVVPRMTAEPGLVQQIFGRQDGAPDEHSFLCVPVSIDRQPVGALGVTVKYLPDRNYDRSTKFFSIVASLIAQAVKVQRLVAAQHKRLVTENARLKQELREGYDFANIVGNSGPMQRVYEAVAQVARTNTTVLIRGESGTGKELIAQAMHYNSLRAKRAFVKVSCGALPETLIESELFGHEKGAFTGAQDRKRGRFELAQNGTIFLDEIGDVQPATQVKLLRVLQEREFERLGGTEPIKVNVRLIAATNKNMEKAIADGAFREDLFYRLNVFAIYHPAASRAEAGRPAAGRSLPRALRVRARQGHPPDLDAGHRHAHGLPLAGQRPGTAERDRTRGARVRRSRAARPPPAAHASDGRSVRHDDERVAWRRDGRLRAGPAPGRPEERARQPRQSRAPAAHDRSNLQLQGPTVGD